MKRTQHQKKIAAIVAETQRRKQLPVEERITLAKKDESEVLARWISRNVPNRTT